RVLFFFSSRRRHTRSKRDWSSDVCSSDLVSNIREPDFARLSSSVDARSGPPLAGRQCSVSSPTTNEASAPSADDDDDVICCNVRSEERRVGKERRGGRRRGARRREKV